MTNPDREELVKLADIFFQAIVDGYKGKIEYGFLIVENPDASPERIALAGVDPNLVLDAKALLIALRRLASSDGGVRELEWRDHSFKESVLHIAPTAFEDYRITYDDDARWPWVLRPFIAGQSNYQTLEAAKAAAQADYDARIRSALITTPPAYAGMREALAYAERLAVSLASKHFKDSAPQWKPLSGDLIGLLTQIDNMTAALTAPGATTKSDGGDLDVRFKRLETEATDLGYVLTPEPEHPDSPHASKVDCRWPACEDDTNCMNGCRPKPNPSDPSSTRSEVTVEGIASVMGCLRVMWSGSDWIIAEDSVSEAARALLDQFEIRRKK